MECDNCAGLGLIYGPMDKVCMACSGRGYLDAQPEAPVELGSELEEEQEEEKPGFIARILGE